MDPWYKKRISAWVTYPLLVIFSVVVVAAGSYFYVPKYLMAQGVIKGFEGTITNIDYVSCVCGLSMLMTITPTAATAQTATDYQFLFFYGAQILEELGVEWEIGGIPIPIPRMYLVAPYVAYDQQALGNYIAINSFPCVAYAGTSCTIEGYYPAIINIGAAALPKSN